MGKHTIFVIVTLTLVWCVLMEGVSWQIVATGMFMGMLSMHLMGKFFNFEEVKNVDFYKLLTYPLWLIGRIYLDAFFLLRLIFSDAKWGVVETNLELKSEFLKILLADSITLTPGSVFLERRKKNIYLLCIGKRDKQGYPASVEGLRAIEKQLIKSEILPEPEIPLAGPQHDCPTAMEGE
ncbi:MAG: Na+/H+ antiporter subunit E [Defluviitaleaceae bacterium]|nr:Na+/H+ antiporter subunit E [Defluviitaleaceae bacterium]MCL2215725.1 Na+/H+ antiporter subunit E [Defluviitaleaceae bacterium]